MPPTPNWSGGGQSRQHRRRRQTRTSCRRSRHPQSATAPPQPIVQITLLTAKAAENDLCGENCRQPAQCANEALALAAPLEKRERATTLFSIGLTSQRVTIRR